MSGYVNSWPDLLRVVIERESWWKEHCELCLSPAWWERVLHSACKHHHMQSESWNPKALYLIEHWNLYNNSGSMTASLGPLSRFAGARQQYCSPGFAVLPEGSQNILLMQPKAVCAFFEEFIHSSGHYGLGQHLMIKAVHLLAVRQIPSAHTVPPVLGGDNPWIAIST